MTGVQTCALPILEAEAPHIARGFQDALIDTLCAKAVRAAGAFGRDRIVLGGGVACNQALVRAMRRQLTTARGAGARVFAPSVRLATDNAAMIASAARYTDPLAPRDFLRLDAYASAA